MKTLETDVYDIRSETIENDMDFEEWKSIKTVDKAMRELSMSRFGRVYYSSSVGKYYRVHFAAEEGNKKLRKTYLMVFTSFTILGSVFFLT